MKNNDRFDINSFISPDVTHAPVYIWVWNDRCNREIIDTQLAEMQSLGIRAFYILAEPENFRPDSMPTRLEPDYLTEEYFELCAYAVRKGRELGMLCWIYDEGGWPSGGACGRVLKDRPQYARQVLKTYERNFSAGEVYKKTSPEVLGAFINDRAVEEGYIFPSDSLVTEYTAEKEICGNADYPDLLNKDATEYFIEITHEKYASAMKNELGNTVTAVFTDEPKAPSRAFSKELAEKYEVLYGQTILPYLPLIAKKTAPTKENVHILFRWYDLCSKTFCENFLLPCKEHANAHGMAFTGHLDKDHAPDGCMKGGGSFNLMRALRCFDIPGVDVIWRQLYPEGLISRRDDMNGYNGFFPRYASSAAVQNGTGLAMSEILGVAGAAVTYDIMRYTAGYLAVRGISIFNLFNFPLGREGQLLAQELPVFTEKQPYYRFLGQFNRYLERLSYIASLGERVCETGLYYPVCDFQGGLNGDAAAEAFDSLGRQLEEMTVDFDIVDDDVIQASCQGDEGCIRMGKAEYCHIIIPDNAYVPQATRRVLERFAEGGGRVSYGLSDLKPVIHWEGEGLRVMHRRAKNSEVFCFFREKGEKGDYKIHLPSSEGYLLDLTSGTLGYLEAENGVLNIFLAVGETAAVLLTKEELKAENEAEYEECLRLSDGFTFRREAELIFDENGFQNIIHTDEGTQTELGDWKAAVGASYSGSGVYETVFTLPREKVGKAGAIELGDVRYAAEVFLNGRPLGRLLMPPYRVKIPAGVLKEENTLKIAVTNTAANLYVSTDYFDKWSIKELSPYFEAELNYARDFVSGGLYGPVSVYTESCNGLTTKSG